MKFQAHDYQKYCISEMVSNKERALFLDMGLGKTVIVLTALWELILDRFELGKGVTLRDGTDVTIIAVGINVPMAIKAAELLAAEGISARVINMHTIKPLDEELIREFSRDHELIVTMEENVASGGYGEKVLDCLYRSGIAQSTCHCIRVTLPDAYVEHGNVELLKKEIGVDADSIAARIFHELDETGYRADHVG